MGLLEIILLILGIIIIFISCKLVAHGKGETIEVQRMIPDPGQLTNEEEKQIKKVLNDLLVDVREEAIIQTDDYLSKLTNEKIMAVTELSDQILEKIKNNHEEVVFLYNMLNDKGKELKTLLKDIDVHKKTGQEIPDNKDKTSLESLNKSKETQVVATQLAETSQSTISAKEQKNNNNKEILSLFSQGKSVKEIAKMLDLGQGEVKLVIDLFKRK